MTRLRHGMARTKVYGVWSSMKARCLNPKVKQYADYGARGVTVCERWLVFDNFLADMGLPPHGMTLERVDNDQGYSPSNCIWASRSAQSKNTRNARLLTVDGETLNLTDWAERFGIKPATVWNRLKLGWNAAAAVKTPLVRARRGVPRGQPIYAFGAEHGIHWTDPVERKAA